MLACVEKSMVKGAGVNEFCVVQNIHLQTFKICVSIRPNAFELRPLVATSHTHTTSDTHFAAVPVCCCLCGCLCLCVRDTDR